MSPLHSHTGSLLETVREWLKAFPTGSDQRLPPERDLAEKFAVNRAQLRKVLATLEQEGLIQRFVGRGTFIVQTNQNPPANAEELAAASSPMAAMQARNAIEPEVARLAAFHATTLQIAELKDLCAAMRRAATWEAYAEADWRFHNVLAEATANVVLVEVQRLINGIRRYVVWGNLIKRPVGPPEDYHSFAEHERVVEAIANRDGDGARQAMLDHLTGTRSHMIDFVASQAR